MTHLLLRLLLAVFLLSPGWAAAQDLFSLKIRLDEALASQPPAQQLARAVEIELIRLSGAADIPSAVKRYFTRRPQRWVLNYQVVPRHQEGVVVGRALQVRFDRERLLEAMKAQGVPYWPAQLRPRLLLTGTWRAGGSQQVLDASLIRQRPDLDLAYVAALLGLEVRLLPEDTGLALRPVVTDEQVVRLQKRFDVDGLMRLYFDERFDQGRRLVGLTWESRLPAWGERADGRVVGSTPAEAFERLLRQRMPRWREAVMQTSGVNRARVVLAYRTPAQLFAFESQLKAASPPVLSVRLVEAAKEMAVFEVSWQGNERVLRTVLSRLQGVRPVRLSAGQVVLEVAR